MDDMVPNEVGPIAPIASTLVRRSVAMDSSHFKAQSSRGSERGQCSSQCGTKSTPSCWVKLNCFACWNRSALRQWEYCNLFRLLLAAYSPREIFWRHRKVLCRLNLVLSLFRLATRERRGVIGAFERQAYSRLEPISERRRNFIEIRYSRGKMATPEDHVRIPPFSPEFSEDRWCGCRCFDFSYASWSGSACDDPQ